MVARTRPGDYVPRTLAAVRTRPNHTDPIMLNSMRKSVGSLGAKILLGLLILAFAAWGVADVFTGRTDTVVAQVGEAEIDAVEYRRSMEDQIRFLQRTRGINLSIEDARNSGIDQLVLRRMTTDTAIDEDARSFGLDASDAIVAETIREAPHFQNAYGDFDKELYERSLGYRGLRVSEYERTVRRELARDGLLQAIGAGTSAPRSLTEALHNYRNEKRSFEYIALSPEDVDDPGEPTDAQLETFHTENAARFTAPEYRTLRILSLTAEDLGNAIEIPDEELRALYDDAIDSYTTPERRNVEQIVFDSEDEAKKALEKVENGDSFAKVAEARGLSASDVALGTVTKSDLPGALADAAFTPEEPGMTGPVGTALGWALLNIRSIEPEKITPFDDVKETLRSQMQENRARRLLPEKSVDADDLIAGGSSLKEAAAQSGARFIEIEAVDSTGRDPKGERIADLPRDPGLLTRAFNLETGEEPVLAETDAGNYFAIAVDGVTEAALRPLDSIEDEVTLAWETAQRNKALETLASELIERLEDSSLKELAEDLGKEVETAGPLTRSDRATPLSPPLMKALFESEEGDALQGGAAVGPNRFVGIVSEIVSAKSGDDLAAIDRAAEAYTAAMAQDFVHVYSQSAIDRHPVRAYPQAIDRALSELGQRY